MRVRNTDTDRRRSAFVGLFIATGAAMLGFGIVEPIMPLYAKTFHASGVALGLIFSGFAITRGIFAPIMGRISDQYGRKRILLLGLGLYVLLSGAYVLANSTVTLIAVRLCQGFASVMVTPVAQSYVGDITPEGKEGSYMNLFYMSLFGGMALGPSVGGYLSDTYSFHAAFYVLGAVALIALVIVALGVPTDSTARNASGSEDEDDDGDDESLSMLASLRGVFADREMKGLVSYIGARGFYRWGFNSFFPVFAVGVATLSKTQVGLILSGYMAVGGILQYPMGRLVDRYPQHRAHLVALGGTLAALSMLIVPTEQSFWPLVALVMGMGAFSAVSRAPSVAIRTERGRVYGMGAVTGAFTMSLSAGQVVGPVVFGFIKDVMGIRAAFFLGGGVGLLGTATAYLFLRNGPGTRSKEQRAAASDD